MGGMMTDLSSLPSDRLQKRLVNTEFLLTKLTLSLDREKKLALLIAEGKIEEYFTDRESRLRELQIEVDTIKLHLMMKRADVPPINI